MILEGFINSEIKTVTLITIEPSLLRSLRERIAHYEMPIYIMDIEECGISDKHIEAWQNDYDEDDFGDVDQVSFIKIEKK